MGVDYTSIPRKDESEVVQVLYDYDDDDSHTALDDDVEYYNIHNHNGSNRLNQRRRCSSSQLYENVRNVLYLVLLVLFGLILGICVGRKHPSGSGHAGHGMGGMGSGNGNGLLPQQAFVPESMCLFQVPKLVGVRVRERRTRRHGMGALRIANLSQQTDSVHLLKELQQREGERDGSCVPIRTQSERLTCCYS